MVPWRELCALVAPHYPKPGNGVCKFRHLLEEHQLGEQILGQVNLHLQAQGVRITTGTIVDATILHAPTSTKNREQQRDRVSECHKRCESSEKSNVWWLLS